MAGPISYYEVNSNTTISTDTQGYLCDVSAGSITLTLPELGAGYNGTYWLVKIINNNGLNINTVTVVPPDSKSGDRIDGATSVTISGRQAMEVVIYTNSTTGRHNAFVKSSTGGILSPDSSTAKAK